MIAKPVPFHWAIWFPQAELCLVIFLSQGMSRVAAFHLPSIKTEPGAIVMLCSSSFTFFWFDQCSPSHKRLRPKGCPVLLCLSGTSELLSGRGHFLPMYLISHYVCFFRLWLGCDFHCLHRHKVSSGSHWRHTKWYPGPSLTWVITAKIQGLYTHQPFRWPVQRLLLG